MRPRRVGTILGGWSEDPLWATLYDWIVEHPRVGGPLWRVGAGSDLGRLYAAADEIGRQPPGARVLDVPCGGGVALRGLRPGQGVRYVGADIARPMLERTAAAAARRGLADQVETGIADVAQLPFADGSFDLVVSFTGLHCFPDPGSAVAQLARVLRPGGVLSGSTMLEDSGPRHEPLRRMGRASGVLGPGCTGPELLGWLTAGGVDATLETSGVMGYFRGVKGSAPRPDQACW